MKSFSKILLSICSVTLTTLPLTLVSCAPTEPEVTKEITIKLSNGNELPPYINVDNSIQLAAFNSNNKKITNAVFSTSSEYVEIDNDNNVKGKGDGDAVISCEAEGFDGTQITIKVIANPNKFLNLDNYSVESDIGILSGDIVLESGDICGCIINYKNWNDWQERHPRFYYHAKSGSSVVSSGFETKHVWFKPNNDIEKWNLLVAGIDYTISTGDTFLNLTKNLSRKITNNSSIRVDVVTNKDRTYTFQAR